MLLWLLKRQSPKIRNFIFKLFVLSIFFHLIILFFILFFNNSDPIRFDIKKNYNHNVPVIFMPLTKTVKGSLDAISTSKSGKIKAGVKKTVTVNKKTIINPEITKKVLINNKKEKIKIKKESKPKNSNDDMLLVEAMQSQKIIASEKKIDPVKNEQAQTKQDDSSIIPANNVEQEAVYVGRNDMEQLEIQQNINKEITSLWKAPAGLSKKLECTVSVLIDNDGKIKEINIIKKSKAIIFDASIKRDLLKAKFPKELWGQEIILKYGPEE